MKHLTDQQSVRAREWMRFKGEPFIRAKTAKYLADLINREDGVDCYTPAHMAARRRPARQLSGNSGQLDFCTACTRRRSRWTAFGIGSREAWQKCCNFVVQILADTYGPKVARMKRRQMLDAARERRM